MKSRMIALLLVMCTATFVATAQEAGATGLGVQVASNGSVGLIYRGDSFEGGIAAQAAFHDSSAEGFAAPDILRPGFHGTYLFGNPTAARRFGIGAEFGTGLGIGDVEWDEYIDLGPRLSLDQTIGNRAYLSAIIFPLWISTRDVAGVEDDWAVVATFPVGRLAVTFLF